jgi:riboflavin synthase
MFTGIITNIGKVVRISNVSHGRRLWLRSDQILANLHVGASLAVNGVCLTIEEISDHDYQLFLSAETLAKSNLGKIIIGSKCNLELPLAIGDRLSGHFVTGHVDGVIAIKEAKYLGANFQVTFCLPNEWHKYFMPKCSVTLDGISLTVNDVTTDCFSVNIIPETNKVTTIASNWQIGTLVNLEVDMISKYLYQQISWLTNGKQAGKSSSSLLDLLAKIADK